MKLLKNVTFAICLLTAFGSQYASDFEELSEIVVATPTVFTAYILTCEGRTFPVSKEFVEACKTLKDCIDMSMDDGSPINIPVIRHEALDLLIKLHQNRECKETIYSLEPKALIELAKAADFLDIRSDKINNAIAHVIKQNTRFEPVEQFKIGAHLYGPAEIISKTHLKVLSPSGQIKVWNIKTGEENTELTRVYEEAHDPKCKYVISPDGSTILSYRKDSNLIRIWNAKTGQEIESIAATYNRFSPDGSILCTYDNNTIALWDAKTGKFIDAIINTIITASLKYGFSRDGFFIYSCPDDITTIWETLSGREIATIEGSVKNDDAWSHDNSKIITRDEGIFKVWNVSTGDLITSFRASDVSSSTRWSPDDSVIVESDTGTYSTNIWNATTGQLITQMYVSRGIINFYTDSSKGAVYTSPEIKIYNCKTGTELQNIRLDLEFDKEFPTEFIWSPDDSKIVVVIVSTFATPLKINIYDTITGELKASYRSYCDGGLSLIGHISCKWSDDSLRLNLLTDANAYVLSATEKRILSDLKFGWNDWLSTPPILLEDGKIMTVYTSGKIKIWEQGLSAAAMRALTLTRLTSRLKRKFGEAFDTVKDQLSYDFDDVKLEL